MLSMLKRLFIATALSIGIVTLMFFLLLNIFFWYTNQYVFDSSRFEKTAWLTPISNADDSSCYRGGMAKDIKNNLLNREMMQAQVVDLLGEADGHSSAEELQYVLGMCSGFDYDVLHVYFNSQGRFTHAQIRQH